VSIRNQNKIPVFQDSLVAKPNVLSWFTWCHG